MLILILLAFIMAAMLFMFLIAGIITVLGVMAMVYVVVVIILGLIGLICVWPELRNLVIDAYWKLYTWVCDNILFPLAGPAGMLTGRFFRFIGKEDWILAKLHATYQEDDQQNDRYNNQGPNQKIHDTSLR